MTDKKNPNMGRRRFLGAAGSLAALPLAAAASPSTPSSAHPAGSNSPVRVSGRRKLGSLEVSGIGMGVQNMHRQLHEVLG
jgi:hypothetical protein